MVAKLDIVEHASVTRNGDGYQCERGLVISGLSGSASARIVEAMESTETPDFGDAHPDLLGLVVVNIEGEAITADKVRLTYRYAFPNWEQQSQPDDTDPDLCDIEFYTSTQSIQTQKDRNGDDIEVTYDGKTQVATINVTEMTAGVRFTRVESIDQYNKARTYCNAINSVAFLGADAKTVKCTSIHGRRVADGRYQVAYEFEYLEQWQPDAWYVDPQTGRPPADLVADTGYKTVDYYKEKDFNELNLPSL